MLEQLSKLPQRWLRYLRARREIQDCQQEDFWPKTLEGLNHVSVFLDQEPGSWLRVRLLKHLRVEGRRMQGTSMPAQIASRIGQTSPADKLGRRTGKGLLEGPHSVREAILQREDLSDTQLQQVGKGALSSLRRRLRLAMDAQLDFEGGAAFLMHLENRNVVEGAYTTLSRYLFDQAPRRINDVERAKKAIVQRQRRGLARGLTHYDTIPEQDFAQFYGLCQREMPNDAQAMLRLVETPSAPTEFLVEAFHHFDGQGSFNAGFWKKCMAQIGQRREALENPRLRDLLLGSGKVSREKLARYSLSPALPASQLHGRLQLLWEGEPRELARALEEQGNWLLPKLDQKQHQALLTHPDPEVRNATMRKLGHVPAGGRQLDPSRASPRSTRTEKPEPPSQDQPRTR